MHFLKISLNEEVKMHAAIFYADLIVRSNIHTRIISNPQMATHLIGLDQYLKLQRFF